MAADTDSWTGELTLRVGVRDLWDLMWRHAGQRQWLGPEAFVGFEPYERSALADDAGVWRTAYVVNYKVPPAGVADDPVFDSGARSRVRGSVTLDVNSDPSWQSNTLTRVVIAIAPSHEFENATRLTIDESGIPAGCRGDVERFWLACMDRLRDLVQRARERRRAVRQAVVVIHGIGEQQPGDTLNSLVKSGVLSAAGTDGDRWVKPDRFSDSYELRCVTLKADETRPATDVYELYWAHVIRDTALNHVATWLQRLLFRRHVPRPLRPLWVTLWLLVLSAVGISVASYFGKGIADRIAYGSLIAGVAAFVWRWLGQPLTLNFIGDAARYLRPHPENIRHRQEIRQAGVQLIERLHSAGRYDRIVIVGHSLGSVIAYDVITHAWIHLNSRHQRPGHATFKDLRAVERSLFDGMSPDDIQSRQHAAWRRQRVNTQPWLVTDLVTLGSPLTYADFLLGKDAADFAQAKADRVMPACPPTTEREPQTSHERMTFEVPYTDPFTGGSRTFVYFHHAAPFAVTRWTNLYFEVKRWGLTGDLIGGPLRGQFGAWVKDVPLESPRNRFTHTWYWRKSGGAAEAPHLAALRDAMALDARDDLVALALEVPAFALVEDAKKERPREPSLP